MENHDQMMKPIINEMIALFTEIMATKNLNENLRITALNGIFVLASTH